MLSLFSQQHVRAGQPLFTPPSPPPLPPFLSLVLRLALIDGRRSEQTLRALPVGGPPYMTSKEKGKKVPETPKLSDKPLKFLTEVEWVKIAQNVVDILVKRYQAIL